MKSLFILSALGLSIGSLAGCAADASVDSDNETDAAEEALTAKTRVTPGEFRLYSDAGHVANPSCDLYTTLELKNEPSAKAVFGQGLDGFCEIAISVETRTFSIRLDSESCGSKVYVGTRGRGSKKSSVRITDHRSRVCRDIVPALVIVEATVPGFPGAITTTQYSSDRPVVTDACASKDQTACLANASCQAEWGPSSCSPDGRICTRDIRFKGCASKAVVELKGELTSMYAIGGETTGFGIKGIADEMNELLLDASQSARFVDGRMARVKGYNVTVSGVEIPSREVLSVKDLLVCPAPGSTVSLMPPVDADTQWIGSNCPGLDAVY